MWKRKFFLIFVTFVKIKINWENLKVICNNFSSQSSSSSLRYFNFLFQNSLSACLPLCLRSYASVMNVLLFENFKCISCLFFSDYYKCCALLEEELSHCLLFTYLDNRFSLCEKGDGVFFSFKNVDTYVAMVLKMFIPRTRK